VRKFSRRTIILAVVACFLLTAGIAFAQWLVNGFVGVPASGATIQNLVVHTTSDLSNLYPGVKKDLDLTVDNPNSFPVQVTDISADITGGTGACPTTNVTFTNTAASLPLLSPGSTGTAIALPDAVEMLLSAPAACSGVPFSVDVTVEGTSP
jgi:hypothetical protein